jgi:hypothetical protein
MLIRLDIERLRKAAKGRGDKTDAMIAARTGVNFSTIWRLTQPDISKDPKVSTFRALGRPYGLKVDDLIIDEDDEAEPARSVA